MGAERRPLGRDDGEIVGGQPRVASVDAENLAHNPEFKGMDSVEQDGGHVSQHAAIVPCRWQ